MGSEDMFTTCCVCMRQPEQQVGRRNKQPDARSCLCFPPRLPATASKCKAQLMSATLPLFIQPQTPHV